MIKALEDFTIPEGATELSLYSEDGNLYLDFRNDDGEALEAYSRIF